MKTVPRCSNESNSSKEAQAGDRTIAWPGRAIAQARSSAERMSASRWHSTELAAKASWNPARLAIDDDGTAGARTGIDEFVERGTLVTSAEQEHDLAIGKRSERLERRIDVGRLGIVEEIDAVNRTAGLETMLERLETQEPFANARRLASTRKRGTCGTKGVLDVMGTLDRELARLRKFDAPSPPILDDERAVIIRESAGSLALGADGHELDAMLVQQRMKLGVGLENGIGDDGR